ncbi:FAD-dependent oxidoreductase [Dactylosporangium sp. NPDC051485]|uniref:FAD-dependent oxidoreductase n=1 Tax=Dactylosporangium sp. NPDC051485 TaxID=3154846 RepID=UPI003420974A
MSIESEPPRAARAVVVGGGVAGCSIAYHLARLGWTDVLLLEQHELTEGTTWHSADSSASCARRSARPA